MCPKYLVSERKRKCSKNDGDMKKNKDRLKGLPLVKSRTILTTRIMELHEHILI